MNNRKNFEPGSRRTFAIMVGVFFLSGFSALLYQVAWQRMIGLFSGSDVISATIIIGAFLGGLGVGSLAGSFLADRLDARRAIRIFGFCNLGIALFAFISRLLYYDLLFLKLHSLSRLPSIEFSVIFISLLFPTALMGLSLPLLSKALTRKIDRAAGRIGVIYGANTLGACAGTLISGWYLIGTYGYEQTVYLGGFLSAGGGIIVLLYSRKFPLAARSAGEAPPPAAGIPSAPAGIRNWFLLFFISGFIAISLELIWFRILNVVIESNAYTFAHLLGFILAGYAVGNLLGSRLVRRLRHPRRAFLFLQGGIVLYSLLFVWALSLVVGWETVELLDFSKGQTGPDQFGAWAPIYLLLPAIMLLPPNILIGFCFPIVQKAVQNDARIVGWRVGLTQLANIGGNVAGSILTGLLIFHFLGTAGALRLIGCLGFIIALLLLRPEKPSRIFGPLLALALLLTVVLFPGNRGFWARLHRAPEGDLFIVAEDSSGVSAIHQRDDVARLYANGQHQSSIPYLPVHTLLGVFPAMVHPEPKQVMIIGIGSGGTPYAAGINPRTEKILAVEILGPELDVLREYSDGEGGWRIKPFLEDDRYEIVIGDGRRELALSKRRFDVIEADAIDPWRSHSGLLYSKEFFEQAQTKLAEGGIMAQYNPTERVESTFLSVFPYVLKFKDFLLGSNQLIDYNFESFIARLETNPHYIAYLDRSDSRYDFRKDVSLIESWGPDSPRKIGEINTDLFPRDEFYINNPPLR